MEIGILILIILAAFVMELIDAGLGMGYGTVLSPLLIAFGYSPVVVVPALLISQAIGGFTAAIFHHRHKNVDFKPKTTDVKKIRKALQELGYIECFKRGFTKDFKIALSITVLGVAATIFGAFVAVSVSKQVLTAYIGILVLVIGLIMVLKRTPFMFSWKRMIGVGTLASFNKGVSGGGFGPVTTGGQVIAGNQHKSSIGCTTLAEAPICITGFIAYLLLQGMKSYDLSIALCIGAFLGAPFGALLTKRLNEKKLKIIIGIIIIALGAWTLFKLF